MKPYLAGTLADRVYEHLEEDILQGKYQPGEMLTEMRLVEEMNISRTPVREALHRLEQEHLVTMTEHGMTVRGIPREDLEDILLIRSRLEGIAARFAAESATEEDLKKLGKIVDMQEKYLKKDDPDGVKAEDDDFHRQIGIISGHLLLAETLEPLHRKISRYRRTSVASKERAKKAFEEHRAIYLAIAAGDGDEAERLTNEHLRHASEHILRIEEE